MEEPRRTFHLVDAVMILLVLGLLVVLLMPPRPHREDARKAVCTNNLKQIGSAFLMYSQDYDERFPPAWLGAPAGRTHVSWRRLISPYLHTNSVFVCPCSSFPGKPAPGVDPDTLPGYGMNTVHREPGAPDPVGWAGGGAAPKPVAYASIAHPASCILAGDAQPHVPSELTRWSNAPGFQRHDPGARLHLDLATYLFADGHVERLAPDKIPCSAGECWWSLQGRH